MNFKFQKTEVISFEKKMLFEGDVNYLFMILFCEKFISNTLNSKNIFSRYEFL